MNGYLLKSSLFKIEPGEDQATNPQVYGKQLAHWIKEKFTGLGYPAAEVIGEDWGYCVVLARNPYLLWIGCQNIAGKDAGDASEAMPESNEIVWHCFAELEVPLFYLTTHWQILLGRIKTKPALAKLDADLVKILKAEAGITFVPEI